MAGIQTVERVYRCMNCGAEYRTLGGLEFAFAVCGVCGSAGLLLIEERTFIQTASTGTGTENVETIACTI